jgi:hypothetical protein
MMTYQTFSFVYFRYNKVLFRYKYGHYIDNYKKERSKLICFEMLCIKKLRERNPQIPTSIQQQSNLTFIEALDFALERKL